MSVGLPEVGSKMSLISMADIRYEGHLYTFDPIQNTIALACVKSYGTEDRETKTFVPPQTQVYDYILFRGTDIKSIRLIPEGNSVLNDPAIMQLSAPPTLASSSKSTFNHPILGQIGLFNKNGNTGRQFRKSHTDAETQVNSNKGRSSSRSRRNSVRSNNGNERFNRNGGRQNNRWQQNGNQRNGNNNGYRGRGRNRSRSRSNNFNRQPKTKVKFEGDYDFDKANTEFEELCNKLDKTKITDGEAENKENAEPATQADADAEQQMANFYDKTKSFFDNISCEAVERSKGRIQKTDWRKERKLNTETFGVPMARRNQQMRGNHQRNYRGGHGNNGSNGYRPRYVRNNFNKGHHHHQHQHNNQPANPQGAEKGNGQAVKTENDGIASAVVVPLPAPNPGNNDASTSASENATTATAPQAVAATS